jgi:outer membrane receptor protein involved in Fe transport
MVREVLDCASPLALFRRKPAMPKRQRAGAVQDAGALVLGCFFLRALRLVSALFLFSLFPAHAQDGGAVSGVVVNSYDGTPLAGATVTVRGTTLAGQTDSTGRFELKNLPPGDQVLRISKSGFAAAVVTDVRVIAGQNTTVNGNLRPEFYEMEEYEVTAEEFTQQSEQIMIERQQSSGMLDAVGSEQLSKFGAGDAAEALGKVSGASIADGKFAVIRGLADRYTTTTLNGTDLPSADPDRKAAQLDLLPTQIIERMDVAKTFSPDMSGGFAGGAIDIVTKSYPEKGMVSFSLGTSYNTQANLNNNFLMSDRGDTDWLAIDDGTREFPQVARNTPAGSGPTANQAAVKGSFKSTRLSPLPEKSPLNSSMALAFGDSFKSDEVKFGYLGSLNYKNDYKFYDDGILRKYNSGTTPPARDIVDAKGVIEYTWAASSTMTLGFGENHELTFNFLYVQSAEDEARRLRGQDDGPPTEAGVSYLDESVLHWTERNLTYYQLAGSHEFPDLKDISFDWAGAISTTTQDEPDYRIFRFLATPAFSQYEPFSASPPNFPTRYWRELEEKNNNIRGDLKIPLPSYNSQENLLKTGVALSDSSRDYYQRGFQMRSTGANSFYGNGDPQSFLDPTNAASVTYHNFEANLTYQGTQIIEAGYVMGDWAALEWLRLVGGVRMERTELSLGGQNQTQGGVPLRGANITRDDLLPSLSLIVSLHEEVKLRAAWSTTLVRPAYREIAPVQIYDIGQSATYSGNPELTFAESQNFDLRLEWYPRAGEIISLSGFMKQIEKPIELRSEGGSSYTFFNAEQADVMGVEFEFRSRLDNLWKPLKEFTFGLNAAYIYSEVPLTTIYKNVRTLWGGTDSTHPMYDQPDYVINADLTWEYEATRTTLTVAGGIVGPRLVTVGLERPDEFEEPAPQLDVFLSQKLGKNWKLKLSAKNLLNPSFETSQTWPQGGKVILKSYTKGITFGISLGCEF